MEREYIGVCSLGKKRQVVLKALGLSVWSSEVRAEVWFWGYGLCEEQVGSLVRAVYSGFSIWAPIVFNGGRRCS